MSMDKSSVPHDAKPTSTEIPDLKKLVEDNSPFYDEKVIVEDFRQYLIKKEYEKASTALSQLLKENQATKNKAYLYELYGDSLMLVYNSNKESNTKAEKEKEEEERPKRKADEKPLPNQPDNKKRKYSQKEEEELAEDIDNEEEEEEESEDEEEDEEDDDEAEEEESKKGDSASDNNADEESDDDDEEVSLLKCAISAYFKAVELYTEELKNSDSEAQELFTVKKIFQTKIKLLETMNIEELNLKVDTEKWENLLMEMEDNFSKTIRNCSNSMTNAEFEIMYLKVLHILKEEYNLTQITSKGKNETKLDDEIEKIEEKIQNAKQRLERTFLQPFYSLD